MKNHPEAAPILRPGMRVLHGERHAQVLAIDSDPTTLVWIVYIDDPDADAFVARDQLGAVQSAYAPSLSASDAYRAQLKRARHMLASLEAMLTTDEARQQEAPKNWGYVGTLSALCEKLGEAAACIKPTA